MMLRGGKCGGGIPLPSQSWAMRVVGRVSGIRHGVSAENGVWCISDLQRSLEFD